MTALSIVVVVLRLHGNYKFGNFQLSDLVTLLALILLVIAAAISDVAVDYGYGQSEVSLQFHRAMSSIEYSAIAQAIILINIVSVFLLFFQCSGHMTDMFHPTEFENCMSITVQIDYAYFQGAFNSACDLLLAAFPVYIFWRFNWNLRVKLVLISLLSLGVVAMVASVVKTIKYPTIMISTNPRTNRVTLLRWMFVEAGVVLITASIPCLRPLVMHWMKKLLRRVPERHQMMPAEEQTVPTTSTMVNLGSFAQDWKSRWIMPFARQEQPEGADLERHILQNITTHIFAGDREFLDRHIPGIVKQVEVTVVADEIPLTDTGSRSRMVNI
ncbi:hypothetical protein BO70DRAFT_342094 [Aspergillus heteromorphus CBS 117.55]|uniref:Rhodopsin domain-containing protein n=1 Tax=Aspergillus heteromorphus CBS 117.55 TaxID=1448321 RepID=A0A317VF93_9EURO|nr:uncharacterized protein BO70DRAFT_342094 [Aspergillus heteromorphus CBS 117.55]PWY73044.1 hypothetical protein BO70DRAFT_342094 [Aspergillus heteromorphus CBS 117.55]